MSEGSQFFQGKSEIQHTLKKISRKLRELGIDYVVVGGLALWQHIGHAEVKAAWCVART